MHHTNTHPQPAKPASGFTLIEITVVIAIIALIAGGILGVSSLMSSSKIQDTVRQIQDLSTHVKSFEAEYGCIPGDCYDITKRFKRRNSLTLCSSTTAAIDATSGTCDGNGDGSIGTFTNTGSNYYDEGWTYFWEHLNRAGYIQDIGELDSTFGRYVIPTSVGRASKLYMVGVESSVFDNGQQIGMVLGAHGPPCTGFCGGSYYIEVRPSLTGLEAQRIDELLDDGMPDSGNILAIGQDTVGEMWSGFVNRTSLAEPTAGTLNDGTSCVVTGATRTYNNLNSDAVLCALLIKPEFK